MLGGGAIRNGNKWLSQKERVAFGGLVYDAFMKSFGDFPGEPQIWRLMKEVHERASLTPERAEAWFGSYVDQVALREGFVPDQETRTALINEAARALIEAASQLRRNAEGDYRPDPNRERFPEWKPVNGISTSAPSTSIAAILDGWAQEAAALGRTKKTLKRSTAPLSCVLPGFLGHGNAAVVSPLDVVRWKDSRLDATGAPLSRKDGGAGRRGRCDARLRAVRKTRDDAAVRAEPEALKLALHPAVARKPRDFHTSRLRREARKPALRVDKSEGAAANRYSVACLRVDKEAACRFEDVIVAGARPGTYHGGRAKFREAAPHSAGSGIGGYAGPAEYKGGKLAAGRDDGSLAAGERSRQELRFRCGNSRVGQRPQALLCMGLAHWTRQIAGINDVFGWAWLKQPLRKKESLGGAGVLGSDPARDRVQSRHDDALPRGHAERDGRFHWR
jgi:hypothetical protein